MNREILFRGKRVDNRIWKEGYYLALTTTKGEKLPYIVGEHGLYHPIDPSTIGQYTGLKDRNSTRIFEGDVLEYYISYSGEVNRSVVVWGDGGWATQDSDFDEPVLIGEIGALAMTIAGNIHDNPELLRGETQ